MPLLIHRVNYSLVSEDRFTIIAMNTITLIKYEIVRGMHNFINSEFLD